MGKRAKAEWQSLDKDLNRLNQLELTTDYVVRPLVGAAASGAGVYCALAGVTAAIALGSSTICDAGCCGRGSGSPIWR